MVRFRVLVLAVLFITVNTYAREDVNIVVKQAVKAWDSGDYERALGLFTRAHELEPDNPAHLWNMARCNETLGHLEIALKQYKQVLAMHPPASKLARLKARIDAIEARIELMKAKKAKQLTPVKSGKETGRLVVLSRADAVVLVDNRRVRDWEKGIVLRPGKHQVTVAMEGYRGCKKEAFITPEKITKVDCVLKRIEKVRKYSVWAKRSAKPKVVAKVRKGQGWGMLKKTLFWSGVSLGVVGLGVNIWAGIEGHTTGSSYDEAIDHRNMAKAGVYTAIGLYGAGAALVVTALVLPDKKGRAVTVIPTKHGVVAGFATEF